MLKTLKLGWVAFHSLTFQLKCLDFQSNQYKKFAPVLSRFCNGLFYATYPLISSPRWSHIRYFYRCRFKHLNIRLHASFLGAFPQPLYPSHFWSIVSGTLFYIKRPLKWPDYNKDLSQFSALPKKPGLLALATHIVKSNP